jgi:hypothetical protein
VRLSNAALVAWRAAGSVAAVVLVISLNIAVDRSSARWDWSANRENTLLAESWSALQNARGAVTAVALLGPKDPRAPLLGRVLERYAAASSRFHVQHVDPERDTAKLVELGQRYHLWSDAGQGSTLPLLVLVTGERHWAVLAPAVSASAEEVPDSEAIERGYERAVADGIGHLDRYESKRVCFTEGHGEADVTRGGPRGAAAFAAALARLNFEVQTRGVQRDADLETCALVVLGASSRAWEPRAAARVARIAERGVPLLVVQGPLLEAQQSALSAGLEPILEPYGLRLDGKLVIETDSDRAVSGSAGATFLAELRPHALTRELGDDLRVVRSAQGIMRTTRWANDVEGAPLLRASERAGNTAIAWAAERRAEQHARLVVFAFSDPVLGSTWEDPARQLEQRLVESAVRWLATPKEGTSKDSVTAPQAEKSGAAPRAATLRLSEAAQGEAGRYVLLYMPGACVLMGFWVFLRRRAVPVSRAGTEPRGGAS